MRVRLQVLSLCVLGLGCASAPRTPEERSSTENASSSPTGLRATPASPSAEIIVTIPIEGSASTTSSAAAPPPASSLDLAERRMKEELVRQLERARMLEELRDRAAAPPKATASSTCYCHPTDPLCSCPGSPGTP